ncbi:hypothetical protein BD779DRAFT_1669289 [Infundibulicybe gibba]|nr:hypothetical protein BD779DRAFT_1669289 [Infundibulicybe gibba]
MSSRFPGILQGSRSDEEDSYTDEEGSRALLGPPEREWGKSPGKIWSQISSIAVESAPTLLFTTIGLLFTGELLNRVSQWRAMREVDQLIIIIPVLLNLKGNLEMNLSARLGTAANMGELDDPLHRRSIILGNLSLLQVQATVVSFVAASNSTIRLGTRTLFDLTQRRPLPVLPNHDPTRKFGFPTFVMLASTAMSAACLSSLILGSFMCGLIVVCRKFGRDPAACLGDLVTLCLIGLISTIIIGSINTPIPFILAILVFCLAVVCLIFTRRNPSVKPLLTQGWSPLFGAMIISSAAGIVLDLFVSRYEGFALLSIVISVEIIFLAILRGFGWLKLPFVFFAFSVVFFCCAVLISLIIASPLTNYLWSKNLDPDLYALPIHSALVDLIGQLYWFSASKLSPSSGFVLLLLECETKEIFITKLDTTIV